MPSCWIERFELNWKFRRVLESISSPNESFQIKKGISPFDFKWTYAIFNMLVYGGYEWKERNRERDKERGEGANQIFKIKKGISPLDF